MSSTSKLLFTPIDAQQTVPAEKLIHGLTDIAWLGAPYRGAPANSYLVGDEFFRYITFMGCSPAMRLEPAYEGDLDFCFIRLDTQLTAPVFRGHRQRFVPRCPHCRHGLAHWLDELQRWQADHDQRFSCPECGADLSLPQLQWREKAAIGSCFIEVYSVYPHEGIPTTGFMAQLKSITDIDWKYFFEPA